MDMELNAAECLEAYGLIKGRLVCAKLFEDIQECKQSRIRLMRAYLMRVERYKKLAKGEKSWSDRWGKPYEWDSFILGSYTP